MVEYASWRWAKRWGIDSGRGEQWFVHKTVHTLSGPSVLPETDPVFHYGLVHVFLGFNGGKPDDANSSENDNDVREATSGRILRSEFPFLQRHIVTR
jgi:hypothetical protein